jgi:hypothetical protein
MSRKKENQEELSGKIRDISRKGLIYIVAGC